VALADEAGRNTWAHIGIAVGQL